MADETRYYYDFNFPMKLTNFIFDQTANNNDPNNPSQIGDVGNREWFSQPRTFDEGGTEVITTIFRLPLSVSEITMDILRMPCKVELWYLDRSNNWREVMDLQRIPLLINVGRSDSKSYFKYHNKIYPIVAKQLQFRLTRTKDSSLTNQPYPVGLRNCLIRRNIYDRSQGQHFLEDEQDVLGNVVAKYIKDWDASRAVDDDPFTFWKSAPMPDPAAVVNLYLDVRTPGGSPKTIDRIYIDPVYSGQHLNLYYSSDDTVGTRKLSPITIAPDEDLNTDWRLGRGRQDVSSGLDECRYSWTMDVGPHIEQDAWIGVEWTPDFDPTDGPPTNPVLFGCVDPEGPAFQPQLSYDVGAGEFLLTLSDGTTTYDWAAPMTELFVPGDPLRIVAGWRYNPGHAYISVKDRRGVEIAVFDDDETVPDLVSFDGEVEMLNFRGLMTALVLKLESYTASSASFQVSPTYYIDPDPVVPDPSSGLIPATTLDNSIYAYPATTQEHGSGGAHETAYEDKEWTPVWRNYVVEKGMMHLPQATSMKYLKFEFTNLTEAPYPVYESGVEVRYKVFPVSVSQLATQGPREYTGTGGYLGGGTFISYNGVRSVNWMDWNSVADAMGAIFGQHYNPVVVADGKSYITDTLPNQQGSNFTYSARLEAASTYIYRRDVLQPYILAEDQYVTIIKADGLQALQPFTDVPWQDIEAANPGAISHVKSLGTMPIRGTDWWIYPGQRLRIPANVMKKLTDTNVVLERKLTLEHRVRFKTQSVHRYEWRTLKRDAAIAYFAGVREIQPYTSTFIAGEDKPFFDFPTYDPDQFVTESIRQNSVGATTTDRKFYHVPNGLFERNLNYWEFDTDAWSWDGTLGRWLRGTARCDADGNTQTLTNNLIDASEGDEIDFYASIKWQDLELDDEDVAIRWGIYTFGDDGFIEEVPLGEIAYEDWSEVAADSDDVEDTTEGWVLLQESLTIGEGVTKFRIFLEVTNQVQSGTVWFESIKAKSADDTLSTVYKGIETASPFAKVAVDFRDSGLVRSDSMWADINPDSESIEDTKLAYYTRTIPETIPGGMWGDTVKAWGGSDVEWGTPFGIVSITVDNNRRYQGKRVLRFRRAAGAGEAGIKVKQWNNYAPLGLFRIGCVFYKPIANDNTAILRLRRLSDGVFVYEEQIEAPAGRWFEYLTKFTEIPDDIDQEYEVYLTLDGDDEDELYLADLYTEIANIRYFMRMGGVGGYLHEVTDLRYAHDRSILTTTTPVNEMSVQATILAPSAWAYGCRITPTYLK